MFNLFEKIIYIFDRFFINIIILLFWRTYFFLTGQLRYPKRYKKFIVKPRDLKRLRKPGISAFCKVKNEVDTIALAIESHLPFVDELVIVHCDSTDGTVGVLESYAIKYPDKVKVFHYEPSVRPPLSRAHAGTPTQSPYSFANYCNFALAKTTRSIVLIMDADHVAIPDRFKMVVDDFKSNGLLGLACFSGVNLYVNNKRFLVNKKTPFTSGFDHWFFPMSEKTFFKQHRHWELLSVPRRLKKKRVQLGVLFYHLRGVKVGQGLANYGSDTILSRKHAQEVTDYSLVSWNEAISSYKCLDDIPDPNKQESLQLFLR